MAKIAVTIPTWRPLAAGDGWAVSDVLCGAGPADRPFEEQHHQTSIAIVVSGTFQYRSPDGCELMTPGSWLLGNCGDGFTCAHEHGAGDRCVSFSYTPEFLDSLMPARRRFTTPRLPPIRSLAAVVAAASGILANAGDVSSEELSVQVAGLAAQLGTAGTTPPAPPSAGALARITRVVRMIDHEPDMPCDLKSLARIARLSPYHFVRAFTGVTGTTPHQYLLRARLRRAALRLRADSARILDVALECGFGDVSNFNRTFRAEFGVSPRAYRSKR